MVQGSTLRVDPICSASLKPRFDVGIFFRTSSDLSEIQGNKDDRIFYQGRGRQGQCPRRQ
jgi:hypothetical protein